MLPPGVTLQNHKFSPWIQYFMTAQISRGKRVILTWEFYRLQILVQHIKVINLMTFLELEDLNIGVVKHDPIYHIFMKPRLLENRFTILKLIWPSCWLNIFLVHFQFVFNCILTIFNYIVCRSFPFFQRKINYKRRFSRKKTLAAFHTICMSVREHELNDDKLN